ncbi:MAG: gamma-glutamyltransferase [Hyphomicrobiales bacterium]
MRNFSQPGRSPVYAENGMVATSHPLASAAALDMLKSGGNAVDAAVCASAVLAVIEPHMTGIGGDCFAIVSEPDGTLHGFNGSGRSAAGAEFDRYKGQGWTEIPGTSPHAITVPGAIDAWEQLLSRCGRKGLDAALFPSINYARNGFFVAPRVAHDLTALTGKLQQNDAAAAVYLKSGNAFGVGDRIVSPALAETLEVIASKGARAFYEGEIAADIATSIQALGGVLSEADLAAHRGFFTDPVSTSYQGHDVFELPPNGQGIAALVILNILTAQRRISDPMSAERLHKQIEAAKLGYGVRDAFISDPAAMTLSVSELIDPVYGQNLSKRINTTSVLDRPVPPVPNADTVYLSVVDRDGMACSFINSLFDGFGTGILTEKTGIMLQSRGRCFSMVEGHPNAVGPSKLPLHTIIPGMVLKDGKPAISFGVMGGQYQACGHAHVLQNMLVYDLNPQAALDFPRAFWDDAGNLELEDGWMPQVDEALREKGHKVVRSGKAIGGGQIIVIDQERGLLIGGSDARKDGLAIGY